MLQELRAQLDVCSAQESQLEEKLIEKGRKSNEMNKQASEIQHEISRTKARTSQLVQRNAEMRRTLEVAGTIDGLQTFLDSLLNGLETAEGEEPRRLLDCIRDIQKRDAAEATQLASLYKLLASASEIVSKFALQCHQLRDSAEERVGSAAQAIPSILDEIFHDRELVIRDVCNMTEFRSDESDRLDHDIALLEKRAEQDMLREMTYMTQVESDLIRAFEYEKLLLKKELLKQREQEKELSFHAKRGTLSKRSTQLTPTEEAIQSKVQMMSEKVTALRESLQSIEVEIAEIERQAAAGLEELTENRRRRQTALMNVHDEHVKHRKFLVELREEREEWMALKPELSRCARDVLDFRRVEGNSR